MKEPGRVLIALVSLLLVLPARSGLAAAPEAGLSKLAAGVHGEESVRAIKRLQHAYGHFQEAGAWDDLAELFTRDAVAEFPDGAVSGREAIRRHFMRDANRSSSGLAAGQLNVHLLLQPIVTLGDDARGARGTWHEMTLLGRYGESASWVGTILENDYAMEQGSWRIRRLRVFEQYRGAFEDYGHKAPARWNVPYHFDSKHVGVTIPAAALEATAPGRASTVSELSVRIARIEDEQAVQNLQHTFGYYFDRKLWDDVTDLFARDGLFEIAPLGEYVGPANIRRGIEAWFGPQGIERGELFDHILTGTVVTVAADGATASARSSELAMVGRNGRYARWEQGTYENRFVKEGGAWKLAAVRYYPRFATDYDLGWARDVRPVAQRSSTRPPDRPSPQRWDLYPASALAGFHFANPATGKPVRVRGTVRTPLVAAGHVSAHATDLANLQRRLSTTIGFDATENQMSSYGYYIDESAWDEMADTYASTGSKEITGAGVYVGPDRIRKVLKLRGPLGGRTANFFTIHQVTQPVIHVAPDASSAKARLRLFQAGGNADGSSGSWIGGIYENTALVENGEWKFGV
ncbi:nuclear transport factor 2 family protein, partial [bacterium]